MEAASTISLSEKSYSIVTHLSECSVLFTCTVFIRL